MKRMRWGPTAECLLLYRGLGQALSGYVMPYSFFTSFRTGGCCRTGLLLLFEVGA